MDNLFAIKFKNFTEKFLAHAHEDKCRGDVFKGFDSNLAHEVTSEILNENSITQPVLPRFQYGHEVRLGKHYWGVAAFTII